MLRCTVNQWDVQCASPACQEMASEGAGQQPHACSCASCGVLPITLNFVGTGSVDRRARS
eukprot:4406795-Amphidinium_carterae.1